MHVCLFDFGCPLGRGVHPPLCHGVLHLIQFAEWYSDFKLTVSRMLIILLIVSIFNVHIHICLTITDCTEVAGSAKTPEGSFRIN